MVEDYKERAVRVSVVKKIEVYALSREDIIELIKNSDKDKLNGVFHSFLGLKH